MSLTAFQGELEHRRVKQRYERTNRRNFIAQMVKMDTVERALDQVEKELDSIIAYTSDSDDGNDDANQETNDDLHM